MKYLSDDAPAEGHEGEFHEFEVLTGKGDTYYSNEEEEGKNKVNEGGVEAAAKKPDDITKKGKTSGAAWFGYDLFAEWP